MMKKAGSGGQEKIRFLGELRGKLRFFSVHKCGKCQNCYKIKWKEEQYLYIHSK